MEPAVSEASSMATLLLSALGLVISAIAVIVSALTARRQTKSALEIHKEQAELSRAMHREQVMLSQRQLFIDIWPKMEALNAIDLGNVVAPDVIRSVNVLELVALCWEGGMVDSDVIRRSFGTRYLELYEVITKVPNLRNPNFTGQDLLRANPAVGRLYDQLRREAQERGALSPVSPATTKAP